MTLDIEDIERLIDLHLNGEGFPADIDPALVALITELSSNVQSIEASDVFREALRRKIMPAASTPAPVLSKWILPFATACGLAVVGIIVWPNSPVDTVQQLNRVAQVDEESGDQVALGEVSDPLPTHARSKANADDTREPLQLESDLDDRAFDSAVQELPEGEPLPATGYAQTEDEGAVMMMAREGTPRAFPDEPIGPAPGYPLPELARTVESAFPQWLAAWQSITPDFDIATFEGGSLGAYRIAHKYPLTDMSHVEADSTFSSSTIDGRKIAVASPQCYRDENGEIQCAVDTDVMIYDQIQGVQYQISSYGPCCTNHDVHYIDPITLVVVGMMEEYGTVCDNDMCVQPFISVYEATPGTRHSRYKGPTVSKKAYDASGLMDRTYLSD